MKAKTVRYSDDELSRLFNEETVETYEDLFEIGSEHHVILDDAPRYAIHQHIVFGPDESIVVFANDAERFIHEFETGIENADGLEICDVEYDNRNVWFEYHDGTDKRFTVVDDPDELRGVRPDTLLCNRTVGIHDYKEIIEPMSVAGTNFWMVSTSMLDFLPRPVIVY